MRAIRKTYWVARVTTNAIDLCHIRLRGLGSPKAKIVRGDDAGAGMVREMANEMTRLEERKGEVLYGRE